MLYASGNAPGADYSAKNMQLLKDADATKILDTVARTPYGMKIAKMPEGYQGAVAKGEPTMLISNGATNPVKTLLHESVHAIQLHVFDQAAKADATGKPKLQKFQEEYAKLNTSYGDIGKAMAAVGDQYRYSPEERLAFGTNKLFAPTAPGSDFNKSFDSAALNDFMRLLDLVPAEFKQTTKQLLKQ
jgi:hypothetical protein